MPKKIIINTSNLQKGGALQVAASFVQEASKITDVEFHVILGRASSKVITPDEFKNVSNLEFKSVNIHPSDSVFKLLKFRSLLSTIETQINPDAVITVFGPCYWKPQAPHIMGFANGYLLYEDTYFFKIWKEWKTIKYRLKKKLQQLLLKREAQYYWTETEDSKNRLAKFLNKSSGRILVASNNCSSFFHRQPYKYFDGLPKTDKFRLLYISAYYPHKNFTIIPKVLDFLLQRGHQVEIVITINQEIYNNEEEIKHDHIINIGPIHPSLCPSLYQLTNAVFMPSLLETFSANYPEAMFMEKPIITTDLPFAKDICGEAALYFKPGSAEDAANKIEMLLSSHELQNKLIKRGMEKLATFDSPQKRFEKILSRVLH